MTGRFGNAIDNFLIIMVAVAVVLLLVVMLGSRQSPFRQKLSRLLVQNPNLQTVQLILYNCINQAQMLADSMKSGLIGNAATISLSADSVRMATTIITVIPIMLVYPFLQKYFVKGVMLGAVKG